MRLVIIALFTLFPFMVKAKPTLTIDQAKFEKKCLQSDYACTYQLVHVKNKTNWDSLSISYLSIDNPKEYNDIVMRFVHSQQGTAYLHTNIGVKPAAWSVVKDRQVNENSEQTKNLSYPLLVRLIYKEKINASAAELRFYSEDFRLRPKQMRRIVIESSPETSVYAEWVNNGIHYYRATHPSIDASFGGIIINLDGWAKEYDGSFYIITTEPSWAIYANKYTKAGLTLVDGSDKLPIFSGSSNQIVQKTVAWMSAHLKYNAKTAYGALPNQSVKDILSYGSGDCKGLDSIFHQILKRSGVESHSTAISFVGMPPRSYRLIDPRWADHIITYIPQIDGYVDITEAISQPKNWRASASEYTGATALDLQTGRFAIVNLTRQL